jgi:hypothetical protein
VKTHTENMPINRRQTLARLWFFSKHNLLKASFPINGLILSFYSTKPAVLGTMKLSITSLLNKPD